MRCSYRLLLSKSIKKKNDGLGEKGKEILKLVQFPKLLTEFGPFHLKVSAERGLEISLMSGQRTEGGFCGVQKAYNCYESRAHSGSLWKPMPASPARRRTGFDKFDFSLHRIRRADYIQMQGTLMPSLCYAISGITAFNFCEFFPPDLPSVGVMCVW